MNGLYFVGDAALCVEVKLKKAELFKMNESDVPSK